MNEKTYDLHELDRLVHERPRRSPAPAIVACTALVGAGIAMACLGASVIGTLIMCQVLEVPARWLSPAGVVYGLSVLLALAFNVACREVARRGDD